MLASVVTVALCGVDAHTVHCEADVTPGIPNTHIVGLPDTSVKESKERVQAAIRNSGFTVPQSRITLNLAPAELPKEGSGFDLPIALSLLAASGQIALPKLSDIVFLGELSLDGQLRPVRGVLVAALHARRTSARGIVVPRRNREEALSIEGLQVGAAGTLKEVVEALASPNFFEAGRVAARESTLVDSVDLSEVKGQPDAKRALEIAAAGGHNILFIGPPGTGKTMLARRLSTILPQLSSEESLEATMIHSVAGTLHSGRPLSRAPFRAPHHTVSDVGLVGGGNPPKPGEVSLAHRGVLFLDELPEFRRSALEALRQPLEDGTVTIVRAGRSARFPARVQLVASMNPCLCGNSGNPERPCTCTSTDVRKYRARVSGPLLDRIDLHVAVAPVDLAHLTGDGLEENSSVVRKRVEAARRRQLERAGLMDGVAPLNSTLEGKRLREVCALPAGGRNLLATALRRRGFSARAIHRVMRVARTIADLEGSETVKLVHLAESVRYRILSEGASGEGSTVVGARPAG
jgi:magnesium chelatase family protein